MRKNAVYLLLWVLCCIGGSLFLLGAEPVADDPDLEYLKQLLRQIKWRDHMPDLDETNLGDINLKRVQELAANSSKPLHRALACTVLSAVQEPSQLDFLIALAAKPENRGVWVGPTGLGRKIAAQVRKAEDEVKLKPLLAEEGLVLGLVWALRNTTDLSLVSKAFDLKYAVNATDVFPVNEFVQYRLNHKLPIDKTLVEAFLRKSCQSRRPLESTADESAKLAVKLQFKWVVEYYVNTIQEAAKSRRDNEQGFLYRASVAVTAIQALTDMDFGAPVIKWVQSDDELAPKTIEELNSAATKTLEWWKEHSADPQHRLNAQ